MFSHEGYDAPKFAVFIENCPTSEQRFIALTHSETAHL